VPDPGHPQSFNRYSYTTGNPLKHTDPSGHGACSGDDYDPACTEDFWDGLLYGMIDNPPNSELLLWLLSMATTRIADFELKMLPVIWLLESGRTVQRFGPGFPMTQEVANDPAIDEFLEEWSETGYLESFEWKHTIDDRRHETPLLKRLAVGAEAYARENIEMILAPFSGRTLESQVDSVGGILGSFDEISVLEVAPGISKIEVTNRMGWASFSRIPGTSTTLLRNKPREEAGPGGTVRFVFYWYIESP
jgi:hypothetical protein